MGFSILLLVGYILLFHPNNAIVDHHIFFIKYAAYIFMINVSLLMFWLPYLYKKNIISPDHHNENDLVKAKANFAVLTILLPGVISIFSVIFFALKIKTLVKWVMLIAFLYAYIKSIYLLYLKK
jgi:hypothetical protein